MSLTIKPNKLLHLVCLLIIMKGSPMFIRMIEGISGLAMTDNSGTWIAPIKELRKPLSTILKSSLCGKLMLYIQIITGRYG